MLMLGIMYFFIHLDHMFANARQVQGREYLSSQEDSKDKEAIYTKHNTQTTATYTSYNTNTRHSWHKIGKRF